MEHGVVGSSPTPHTNIEMSSSWQDNGVVMLVSSKTIAAMFGL